MPLNEECIFENISLVMVKMNNVTMKMVNMKFPQKTTNLSTNKNYQNLNLFRTRNNILEFREINEIQSIQMIIKPTRYYISKIICLIK